MEVSQHLLERVAITMCRAKACVAGTSTNPYEVLQYERDLVELLRVVRTGHRAALRAKATRSKHRGAFTITSGRPTGWLGKVISLFRRCPMSSKSIEINVGGCTGTGKTHVLSVIEKALREAYGDEAVIVSKELQTERDLLGSDENFHKPNVRDTTFRLTEQNQPCIACQDLG